MQTGKIQPKIGESELLTGDGGSTWCDSPDIEIGNYVVSACNVGATKAGTGEESYGNYYSRMDFDFLSGDIQWPCASGYYVPTSWDWETMYYLGESLGMRESDNGPQFRDTLLLPMAWLQSANGTMNSPGEIGSYWSSTISANWQDSFWNDTSVYNFHFNVFRVSPSNSYISYHGGRLPIRCFKLPNSAF